jgi:hypothetical protein
LTANPNRATCMSVYYSTPAPRPGGESVFQDATCRIVALAPYLILCAASDTSLSSSAVAGMRRGLEQVSQGSEQIGYLVLHDAPFRLRMAPEVRTGLTLALQRFEDRIAAAAIVYEEPGFKATAIRSLLSAMHATSRAKHPVKVFAEARPALQWMQVLLPESKHSLGELTDFVRDQRKRQQVGSPVPAAPSSRH